MLKKRRVDEDLRRLLVPNRKEKERKKEMVDRYKPQLFHGCSSLIVKDEQQDD
uniref:Uncharacterized protein n=1 Tax=Utricularia reniformis TaxID=192314 RepID=A0A1Y0B0M3_9LAMI|nr:hypothetical protein AEK19_MT0743 [Utricularia reniformis]ART30985.1 hypothetical protein AEK19_MT0743 [Utricularia reniformis]